MKKFFALILVTLFCLSLAMGCSPAEEPSSTMGFDLEVTPAPVNQPVGQPPATGTQDVGDLATATGTEPATSTNPATSTDPAAVTPSPTPNVGVDATAQEDVPKIKSMKDAVKVNSDVYGWIKVPNTNIDYPILYSKDFYYDTHDINKKKSNNGSIYCYYNMLTRNNTITGHNMRVAGVMFHELHDLQDKADSLKTKENRTFEIDWFTLKKWEVFALYETKDEEPADTLLYNTNHLATASDSDIQAWINKQISRSQVDLGVTPSTSDYFITLVTCGDAYDYATAQSRLYYFLRCPDPAK